jgi:tetratricopeptide (TPR) repeat protein
VTRTKRRRSAKGPAIAPVHGTPFRRAIPALVIVLAGLLVYWNGLSSPFLFDDRNSIVENSRIRTLWPLSIPLSPPRDTPVAGRPVVNLSFALNYAIGGLEVGGYHLFNLAVHLLAALTVFGVVRRTLLLPRLADRFGGASTSIASACALVWMLHPLQTEAVNYLSHRTESMMGLFYLVTLYCSIRAAETGGRRRGAEKWRLGAIAACATGMACKESMVTAPLMVALYDRIFLFDSLKASLRARRGLYAALAATWLVLAALMASRPRTSVGFDAGPGSWVYLLNQFELIVQYLRLTLWPHALVLDYGLPRPLALKNVLPQAALVVTLAVAVLVALVRRPPLGFLGAWFFMTLAPTTSIVPIATEVGAERRMYLPLAAVAALAAVGCHIATRGRRSWGIAATTTVCALLAAGTMLRNGEYQSRLSIAETIVRRWPSGRAHYILGVELLRAGRRSEAMAELRGSVPDYPEARYALGTELFADGKLDAAINELRAFVEKVPLHPNIVRAHDQLGRAFLMQGRLDEALEQFNLVLAEPDYPLRSEVMSMVEEISAARRGRLSTAS